MEHPPIGLATKVELEVVRLGSVLMVTRMIKAGKIYPSLGYVSQQ